MAQSLKQLIAVNAADLSIVQNALATLTVGDLNARIDVNAALIATNQSTLTTLTATAEGTQSALAVATSGFTTALADLETRAYAADEVVRLGADAGIAIVASDLAAEQTRAEAAEVALGIRVDDEASARSSDISAEVASRNSAIAAGDAKMCFAHVMEFDGVLVAGAYPFSHGAGVPSAAGFGVQIPMDYRFVGYGIECNLASAFNFVLEVEGYMVGETSVVDWTSTVNVSGGRNYSLLTSQIRDAGQVCVKVDSLANSAAPSASDRFRVTLYFQSAYGF